MDAGWAGGIAYADAAVRDGESVKVVVTLDAPPAPRRQAPPAYGQDYAANASPPPAYGQGPAPKKSRFGGMAAALTFPGGVQGADHLKTLADIGTTYGLSLEYFITDTYATRYTLEYVDFVEKEHIFGIKSKASIIGLKIDYLIRSDSHSKGFYALLGFGASYATQKAAFLSFSAGGSDLSLGGGYTFGAFAIELKYTQSLWWKFGYEGYQQAEDWGNVRIGIATRF